MATKQDIEALLYGYRQAELTIIELLKEISIEAVGTRDWYQQQATALRQLMEKARTVLAAAEPSQEDLERVLTNGWVDGVAETAAGQLVPAPAMTAVAVEQGAAFTSAGLNVLRSTEDAFRDIARVAVGGMVASGADRNRALQNILNDFAANGITAYRDTAGRRWGLDTYGEMVLRTGVNRAQNAGRINGYRTAGVTLLLVSQHKGADAHCLPFQNRILSTDGMAGDRTVIDRVTGEPTTVHVTATFEDAVAQGLLHVNCRHTLTSYTPGVELPDDVDATEEDFLTEQQQRHNERMIRQWKRREAAAMDDRAREDARKRVRFWQARQRQHLKDNPWLVRRYDREKVWASQAGRGRKIEKFTPKTRTTRRHRHVENGGQPVAEILARERQAANAAVAAKIPTIDPDTALGKATRTIKTKDGRSFNDVLNSYNLTPPRRAITNVELDQDWLNRQHKAAIDEWIKALKPADRKTLKIDMHTEYATEKLALTFDPGEGEALQLAMRKRRVDTLDKVGTLPKGKRTWDSQIQAANPRYGTSREYGVNCVRVSVTTDLRMRGYDVTAGQGTFLMKSTRKPRYTDPNYSFAARRHTANMAQEMDNVVNNAHEAVVAGYRTKDGKCRSFYKANEHVSVRKGAANAQTLKDMTDHMPEGASGFAAGDWKGRNAGGHIWNWVKQDGEIRWFEAQTQRGFIDINEYLEDLRPGTLEMIRVDDLVPVDEILGVVGVD